MQVEQYLINFTYLVEWDVNKLIAVAKEGGRKQPNPSAGNNSYATRTQTMSFPVPTPTSGIMPPGSGTGMAPLSAPVNETDSSSESVRLLGNPFLEQHTLEAAKCAVPMAMALIAAAEFTGAMLSQPNIWADNNKFDRAIRKFFGYAGFPLDNTEYDVLRQSFRNGMAHNFMMQGKDVSIDYQQRFESINRLLFTEYGQVVLNVNKLQKIVFDVFKKLRADTSVYATVATSVQEYETGGVAQKTAQFLTAFRAYDATRL